MLRDREGAPLWGHGLEAASYTCSSSSLPAHLAIPAHPRPPPTPTPPTHNHPVSSTTYLRQRVRCQLRSFSVRILHECFTRGLGFRFLFLPVMFLPLNHRKSTLRAGEGGRSSASAGCGVTCCDSIASSLCSLESYAISPSLSVLSCSMRTISAPGRVVGRVTRTCVKCRGRRRRSADGSGGVIEDPCLYLLFWILCRTLHGVGMGPVNVSVS